jgi:hypothetical protein
MLDCDWSSDVCSSDLVTVAGSGAGAGAETTAPHEREDALRSALACGVTHVFDRGDADSAAFALRARAAGDPELARLHLAGGVFGAQRALGSAEDVERGCDELLAFAPDCFAVRVRRDPSAALDVKPLVTLATRTRAASLALWADVESPLDARVALANGAAVLAWSSSGEPVEPSFAHELSVRAVPCVPSLAGSVGARRAASERSPYANALARTVLAPEVYASVTGGQGRLADEAESNADASDPAGAAARRFRNVRALADGGVTILVGSGAGRALAPHGPATIEELALLVEAGEEPQRALRAATYDAARVLRVDGDFGSLAAGKIADVVVVRGDPTRRIDELWNVVDVYKAGRRVDRAAGARRFAARAVVRPKLRVGADVAARIDDFDDGDLASAWGGEWTVASDAAAGGSSSATLAVRDGALRVEGELRAGFAWGPFAGAALAFDARGAHLVDASDFDGVRLRARGTQRSWTLALHRAAVKDFDAFTADVELTPEWRELTLPFSAFARAGVGEPVPWSAADLTGLELSARAPYGTNEVGPFWCELDRLEFHRAP